MALAAPVGVRARQRPRRFARGSCTLTLSPRALPGVHSGSRAHARQSAARAEHLFMPVPRSNPAKPSVWPAGHRQASSAST